MQWLKRVLPKLLVLVAIGVVVAAMLSDHSSEYGQVTLPGGGAVELPEGKTTVFVDDDFALPTDPNRLASPLALAVVSPQRGQLQVEPSGEGLPGALFQRSEAIGSSGSVASIEVPSAGRYLVAGTTASREQATVQFGQTSFQAVAGEWKVIAALLAAAILISLMPLPRREREWKHDAPGASDGDPGEPLGYSPRPVEPYRG